MAGIVVTVELGIDLSWDVELPGDVPVGSILSGLPELGIPASHSRLAFNGRAIPAGETLRSAGVKLGSILILVPPGGSPLPGGSLIFKTGRAVALRTYGKAEISVGRPGPGGVPDIDLSLELGGDSVSRHHAMLRATGRTWALVSGLSLNPTKLNGAPVLPQSTRPLTSGDLIQVGEVHLTFRSN